MGWKIGVLIGGLIIIALSTSYFLFFDHHETANTNLGDDSLQKQNIDEMNENVVNPPADESVVTMGNGKDGHQFIRTYHNFYNDTLGWGRLATADYNLQVEKAKEILQLLDGAVITNEKIAEDFYSIKKTAEIVVEKDDREAMRKLHRLFHDLDIYFNGYDYKQTFGVTKYRGE